MPSGGLMPPEQRRVVATDKGFPASAITEAEVRDKFNEFIDALKTGDVQTLERIYRDDYLLVRPDGTILTKRQILDDLKGHSMIFTTFETAWVRIKTEGPVGLIAAESRAAFLRDGQQSDMHAQQ